MITNNQFCYWDSKSLGDVIILAVNSLTALALVLWAIYNCRRFRAQHQMGRRILYIYLGVLLWGAAFLATNLFSIVVYLGSLRWEARPDMTGYSRVFAFVETVPAIVVQTLLFMIAESMVSTSMGLLLSNNTVPGPRDIRTYKFMRRYKKLRALFLAVWLMILLPFSNLYAYEAITQVKILLLMVDCGIIVWLLYFCHRFLGARSGELLPDSRSEQLKLNSETKWLIICGICRFVLDLTFYLVFPFVFIWSSSPKPCLQPFHEHLEFSILYLALGTHLMHHLSIFVVVRMYRVEGDGRVTLLDSEINSTGYE